LNKRDDGVRIACIQIECQSDTSINNGLHLEYLRRKTDRFFAHFTPSVFLGRDLFAVTA
jgi:hypothetical protein